MIDAVRNLHGLGVPLEDALRAASEVPARMAGAPISAGSPRARRRTSWYWTTGSRSAKFSWTAANV